MWIDEWLSWVNDPWYHMSWNVTSTSPTDYTSYNNPQVIALSHKAQRETNKTKRGQLYTQLQTLAANDAFQGFLYYSPYRWATTSKVHGFFVQPLGNYHLENVWLG